MIRYESYVEDKYDEDIIFNKNGNCRRKLIGIYKTEDGEIHKGDNFDAVNIKNDAEKSYKIALEYFNYTLHEGEKKRIFHKAIWEDEIIKEIKKGEK